MALLYQQQDRTITSLALHTHREILDVFDNLQTTDADQTIIFPWCHSTPLPPLRHWLRPRASHVIPQPDARCSTTLLSIYLPPKPPFTIPKSAPSQILSTTTKQDAHRNPPQRQENLPHRRHRRRVVNRARAPEQRLLALADPVRRLLLPVRAARVDRARAQRSAIQLRRGRPVRQAAGAAGCESEGPCARCERR